MLNDLLSVTNSSDFDEYGTIDLVGLRIARNMILSLDIRIGGYADAPQSWEVECEGVLENQVSFGPCDGCDLYRDHVLLWPYIYPHSSVSFYGEAENHLAVVGALFKRHLELVENWIPFDRFLNRNPVEMIRGRYGMLADGPLPLIESYAKVLDSFGLSAGISNPRPAPYINDEFGRFAEVGVLIFQESSYLIATKFNATRLSDT